MFWASPIKPYSDSETIDIIRSESEEIQLVFKYLYVTHFKSVKSM